MSGGLKKQLCSGYLDLTKSSNDAHGGPRVHLPQTVKSEKYRQEADLYLKDFGKWQKPILSLLVNISR